MALWPLHGHIWPCELDIFWFRWPGQTKIPTFCWWLRMVRLMFVSHEKRWVDNSLRNLTGDWLRHVEERFAGKQRRCQVVIGRTFHLWMIFHSSDAPSIRKTRNASFCTNDPLGSQWTQNSYIMYNLASVVQNGAELCIILHINFNKHIIKLRFHTIYLQKTHI